jgi:crotonobetainyl-CoA:carnitine CoA-transferase CaiB-like acyl-CoA transferase
MTAVMQDWTSPARAGRSAGVELPLSGQVPCYQVYAVADGWLTVAALEPKFWSELCQAIERRDLIPRQFDPAAIEDLAAIFRARTRAEWMAYLADRDVCVEPLLSLEESSY